MRRWFPLVILLLPSLARADEAPDCSRKGTKCLRIETNVSIRADLKIARTAPARAYLPVSAPRPQPAAPPPSERDHGFAGLTGSFVLVPGAERLGGGAGGSFRIRGAPALALDLGASWVGYRDASLRRREDTALALSAFMYPIAGASMQPYVVTSFLHDWSHADSGAWGPSARWRHVGGALGLGLETFVGARTSLFADARALLRFRYGGDRGPEFQDGGRAADTSVGVVVVLGVALYAFGP